MPFTEDAVRVPAEVVRPSPYARRITADTAMRIAGPARGHRLMANEVNPDGDEAWGR